MAQMGNYCKAYPVAAFRRFNGWTETRDSPSPGEARGADDTDHLFLQQDLSVTEGIFLDERVVFRSASPEWKRFCDEDLNFRVSPSAAADVGDSR